MESLFCSVEKYILGKYFENIFLVLGKIFFKAKK
jgi:hypothetical protein